MAHFSWQRCLQRWLSSSRDARRSRRSAPIHVRPLEMRIVPSGLVVNTPFDEDDAQNGTNQGPAGPDGLLSLREAINWCNLGFASEIDLGCDVTVDSALPGISVPIVFNGNGFTISGGGISAPGLLFEVAGNTVTGVTVNGFDANPDGFQMAFSDGGNVIENNFIGTDSTGTVAVGGGSGMYISGSNNTVENNVVSGLTGVPPVSEFNTGYGGLGLANGGNNLVEGNKIGTDVTGKVALGNAYIGLYLSADGSNTIQSNVISDNAGGGMCVVFSGSSSNLITGNMIGVDANGTTAMGNGSDGIAIIGTDTSFNTIGGATAGAGNVISANAAAGIEVIDPSTTGTVIEGNYIGTDVTGEHALGNGNNGIGVVDATATQIGGDVAGAGNLISNNGGGGIVLLTQTTGAGGSSVIQDNIIGTDLKGTTAMPNGTTDGIDVINNAHNTIGGTGPYAANLISGNGGTGVVITGTTATGNLVEGNFIGTDVSGAKPLGNSTGVLIDGGASGNTVGGTTAGAANIIAASTGDGVDVLGSGTNTNLVEGNFIGTDSAGDTGLGNRGGGVVVAQGAASNTVGGSTTGAANVIAASTGDGLDIFGTGTDTNLVAGNFIGTDSAGATGLGNGGGGLVISGGAASNTVGGLTAGAANVIAANTGDGLDLIGKGTAKNLVEGNFIGTDSAGAAGLGNGLSGLVIAQGATGNTVGGTASAATNCISGNSGYGVRVTDRGTSRNVIAGNRIGTDPNGSSPLANRAGGVILESGATKDTLGGTAAGAGNVISGNGADGVDILGPGTGSMTVAHNIIGLDATGTTGLGNAGDGVLIVNAAHNTVSGNVVAMNGFDGIAVTGRKAVANLIDGDNFIGTNTFSDDLGNAHNGVTVSGGANGNTISANAIAANAVDGVELTGAHTSANLIVSNTIGEDVANGVGIGNGGNGITVAAGANGNTIGGTASGAGNVIGRNGNDGILVRGAHGVTISENSIRDNNHLGIELAGTANNDVEPPVLKAASISMSGTTVQGILKGPANATFTLEFFANPSSDGTTAGVSGDVFLGSITVTTSATGVAKFKVTLSATPPAGDSIITATATDAAGDTSEFSNPVTATGG